MREHLGLSLRTTGGTKVVDPPEASSIVKKHPVGKSSGSNVGDDVGLMYSHASNHFGIGWLGTNEIFSNELNSEHLGGTDVDNIMYTEYEYNVGAGSDCHGNQDRLPSELLDYRTPSRVDLMAYNPSQLAATDHPWSNHAFRSIRIHKVLPTYLQECQNVDLKNGIGFRYLEEKRLAMPPMTFGSR
jgi:hypothetical protein